MALSYVLKPENLALAVTDKKSKLPVWKTMHSSHVSFASIVRALKKGDEKRALRLFDTAQLIADKSQGKVQVKKDGVFYNGTLLNNSLTTRILQLIKENKPVSHILKFMDRLYLNPSQTAVSELYDWLNGCKLPITDDGRFVAYKRVRSDYKDVYTGTIDYSPGQIVFMKREDVCPNRHNTCAEGLHFCSIAYLPNYGGDRIMQVLVDPADVVSIPSDYQFTKGRTWQLEVVKEIPQSQIDDKIDRGIDIDEYQVSVYSISSDRKKLLAEVLALPLVKKMIRKAAGVKKVKKGRKAKNEAFIVSRESISKMTIGRLANLYKLYAPPVLLPVSTNPFGNAFYNEVTRKNRLFSMRKSYGFSMGDVQAKMKVSYKTVSEYESARSLPQATIDAYIDAIMKLSRLGTTDETGISFPKKTTKRSYADRKMEAQEAGFDSAEDFDYDRAIREDADEFGFEIEEEEEEIEF